MDFVSSVMAKRPQELFPDACGVETLGASVVPLHVWLHVRDTGDLPHERRLRPGVCPVGTGDYYYGGPVPGGTALEILNVIKEYLGDVSCNMDKGLSSTYGRPQTSTLSWPAGQAAVPGVHWGTRYGHCAGLPGPGCAVLPEGPLTCQLLPPLTDRVDMDSRAQRAS